MKAHGERSDRVRGARKPARERAERVYGLAAALAAFETRPEAVVSIAHTAALRQPLAALLREAARRHIAYREVDTESLTRMAQSVHHEGVCLLAHARPVPSVAELVQGLGERGLLLGLDGVQNPHNIGAILRSAAYFGARGLVYTRTAESESEAAPPPSAATRPPAERGALPAAARRVAEGGAEYLPALSVASLSELLREAKRRKLLIIGTDARARATAASFAWPARAVLVLGHEQHGMTRGVREQCDQLLRIAGPGAEHIDSLNVSVAAGILLASYASARGAER